MTSLTVGTISDEDGAVPVGMVRKLVRNAARCGCCGDLLESTRRHQVTTCSCGAVSVDGGLAYQRRSVTPGVTVEGLSDWELVPCRAHTFFAGTCMFCRRPDTPDVAGLRL